MRYVESKEESALQCDASSSGLSHNPFTALQLRSTCRLCQQSIGPTEQHYVQTEKERLAGVFGMERFQQYTYCCNVLVESDHKPLQIIHKKPLVSAPKCLQHMQPWLKKYDKKPGKELHVADSLLRAHLKGTDLRTLRSRSLQGISIYQFYWTLTCTCFTS